MSGVIGVYDSGYGGLTVLRALRAVLPDYDFLYFGDNGRAPYGGRDPNTVLDFAEQCTEYLLNEGCRLIVVACHTVSCVGLRHLQQRYVTDPRQRRILGVTIPGAEAAIAASAGHIGVIGTTRTVQSGTFPIEIAKLGPHKVSQVAAPLLAPLVEEGWEDSDIARLTVGRYLDALPDDVDTLLLGCTHYPLLMGAFRAVVGDRLTLLDPAPFIATRLQDWLARHPGFVSPGEGRLRVLCTGDPNDFRVHGARFLGAGLPDVAHVSAEEGALIPRDAPRVQRGQVVRG